MSGSYPIDEDGYYEPEWVGLSGTCWECGRPGLYIENFWTTPCIVCCYCHLKERYSRGTPLSTILNDIERKQGGK